MYGVPNWHTPANLHDKTCVASTTNYKALNCNCFTNLRSEPEVPERQQSLGQAPLACWHAVLDSLLGSMHSVDLHG
jgi:hypothetical protein